MKIEEFIKITKPKEDLAYLLRFLDKRVPILMCTASNMEILITGTLDCGTSININMKR
jgi:hypothetical protein